jgi:hypothetical protein
MGSQFYFERIHVHVVKFFDSLFEAPNVEVVESALPETPRQAIVISEA